MSRYIDLDGITWDGKSISSKIRCGKNTNNMSYITIGWLYDAPCIDLDEHDKEIRAEVIDELKTKFKQAAETAFDMMNKSLEIEKLMVLIAYAYFEKKFMMYKYEIPAMIDDMIDAKEAEHESKNR